ncbi:MAG: peptidylprolyl isomerase [Pirellulaceae bacterium]
MRSALLGACLSCWLLSIGLLIQPACMAIAEDSFDANPQRVVAEVDGMKVLAGDVLREMEIVLRGRELDSESRRKLFDATSEQLIKQRRIIAYLRQRELAASKEDVDFAVERLRAEQSKLGREWDSYLRQQRLTDSQLRDRLTWQISWQRYLERFLTDENLARYFEKHRPHFDGSQFHVAHIVIRPHDGPSESAWQAARQRATDVYQKIMNDELTFAEAARQYSESPTGEDGGDIGKIERHQPMPESFSKAAFELKVGEVSRPVATSVGIHIIHCLAIEPGKKTWRESRRDLETAVTAYLFEWCAGQFDKSE